MSCSSVKLNRSILRSATILASSVILFFYISCKNLYATSVIKDTNLPSGEIKVSVGKSGDLISGYANSRLPRVVGPDASVIKGSGGRPVRYGLEVSFDLSATDYDLDSITIKRVVIDRKLKLNALDVHGRLTPTEAIVSNQSDNPILENIQKIKNEDGRKVIKLADGPGVVNSLFIDDPEAYPISMDATFKLELQHRGQSIFSVHYQVSISSEKMGSQNKGQLNILNYSCSP